MPLCSPRWSVSLWPLNVLKQWTRAFCQPALHQGSSRSSLFPLSVDCTDVAPLRCLPVAKGNFCFWLSLQKGGRAGLCCLNARRRCARVSSCPAFSWLVRFALTQRSDFVCSWPGSLPVAWHNGIMPCIILSSLGVLRFISTSMVHTAGLHRQKKSWYQRAHGC